MTPLKTTPLKVNLNPLSLGNYSKGAYIISYSVTGELPKNGVTVFLALSDEQHVVDITGRLRTDVLGVDNLPQVLKQIDALSQWGKSIDCSVFLKHNGQILARSNSQNWHVQ